MIHEKALEVALTTAPSGFDTYFLALALLTDSLLVTDDKGMAEQARRLKLNVIFPTRHHDQGWCLRGSRD